MTARSLPPSLIERLDHVGIVAPDVAASVALYCGLLGMQMLEEEELRGPGLHSVMLGLGAARFELLSPTRADTPISRFLERRGPGIHHLAFQVASAEDAIRRLVDAGVELIDTVPQRGAGGTLTAFAHPHSTQGVLLEVVEHIHTGGGEG